MCGRGRDERIGEVFDNDGGTRLVERLFNVELVSKGMTGRFLRARRAMELLQRTIITKSVHYIT